MSSEKVDPFVPDDDTPVWTDEEIARARPGREVFAEIGMVAPRPRGRPKLERPKERVSLRVDADILNHFRAKGPGWQTEINRVLRDVVGRVYETDRPATSGRFTSGKAGAQSPKITVIKRAGKDAGKGTGARRTSRGPSKGKN